MRYRDLQSFHLPLGRIPTRHSVRAWDGTVDQAILLHMEITAIIEPNGGVDQPVPLNKHRRCEGSQPGSQGCERIGLAQAAVNSCGMSSDSKYS